MLNITTIGGGNGQSNLLDGFFRYFEKEVNISSIVSMSDDGRTTGKLMKSFEKELGLHLPPPGDLRRCFFSLSSSKYRDYFSIVFEHTFLNEKSISSFSILDLFNQANNELLFLSKGGKYKDDLKSKDSELCKMIIKNCGDILDFKLPLTTKLKGHKFGNILMASIFYNFEKNKEGKTKKSTHNISYDKMIAFMHNLLEVKGNIIPVTTKKAYIRAVLGNGEVIESQDRISNVADYNSGIADLELMDCSIDARHNHQVHDAIVDSDFIIIGPGDLFTSLITNFIIAGVKDSIIETKAKIIYIGNSTNKGGETIGLTQLDFVNKIERFLGKRIDYFVLNNKKPNLSSKELEEFKNDISVKGGDYLFLTKGEKQELDRRKVVVIEADLLGEKSFYKHSKKKLLKILEKVIFDIK